MADRSFEPLPPGWGALSVVRASRKRRPRWPLVMLGLAVLACGLVVAGWISRA